MRFLFIADLSITLGTGISKEMVGWVIAQNMFISVFNRLSMLKYTVVIYNSEA
jgi:hypothetical protein